MSFSIVDANLVPSGFQKISSLSSSTGLTPPQGARFALIAIESAGVRWRDDGSAPTATDGMPQAFGDKLFYNGDLSKIKFIQTASGAQLSVSYYL